MRIIGGRYKGKRLQAPSGLPTRPTTDFAKEALFNIVENQIEITETDVLDLFGGIGGISFEFASRGAKSVTSVERNNKCCRFINQTIRELDLDNLSVTQYDAFKYVAKSKKKFNLIFADPPYELKEAATLPDLIFEKELLQEDGLLIVEHAAQLDFSNHPKFVQHRKYSAVNFSFFQ